MSQNKLSAMPPKIGQEEVRKKFIEQANQLSSPNNTQYPWQEPKVREDLRKSCTVNIPETYSIKLKFLSEKTNKAQQKIARELLCSGIDELLKDVI